MQITHGFEKEFDHNKELWKIAEKLALIIPREGEHCFYFPQGHLEQLDLSTKHEFDYNVSRLNPPSQIFCRVLNIGLSVQQETKEIHINFTIVPEIEMNPRNPDPNQLSPEIERQDVEYLFNRLMSSHANACAVMDVSTGENMHLGVLATSSHAVKACTMFSVHYQPSASPFVIRLNKYIEAENNNFHVGMKFKMRFQSEDSSDRSCFGTIIGIEDNSPLWTNSKWRCLKVQWDAPATFPRPEWVSPWEIQPIAPIDVKNVCDAITVKSKWFNLGDKPSSKTISNSLTSPPAPATWNGYTSFLSELGKDKAILKDSTPFVFEPEKDKANTSALARFCSWFCCRFK